MNTKTFITVWELPTRVFHGLLALSFAGAYLTGESDRLHLWHMGFGFTLAGLIVYRVIYGLVGARYARFASFLPSFSRTWRYIKSMFRGAPEHYLGHNPLGAWAVYALLLLGLMAVATGMASEYDWGGDWLGDLHEFVTNAMLALVGFHVLGVIISSLLHRENLVRAMINGKKAGSPEDATSMPLVLQWILAVLIGLAVLAAWIGLPLYLAP